MHSKSLIIHDELIDRGLETWMVVKTMEEGVKMIFFMDKDEFLDESG